MSYPWQREAAKEAIAARIPKGEHRVRIVRIVTGNRDGEFQSRDGDPQIMPIFQDDQAREAGQMITLNEKAAWTLAKILDACDPPANLARMEADGIEPRHFANPDFAESVLLNRQLDVSVDYEDGQDGKRYARVTPIKRARDAAAAPSATEPPPSEPPSIEPPPAAAAPSSEPPPSSPAIATKDQAWVEFLRRWGVAETNDEKAKRNTAWFNAIRSMDKPETQFTPEDWASVVARAEVPF